MKVVTLGMMLVVLSATGCEYLLDLQEPTLDGVVDPAPIQEDNISACAPGTQVSCYSGPADTEGVGVCQGGIKTCSDDGQGYGPCLGEHTPEMEACDGPAIDEDCDGRANAQDCDCDGTCPGSISWTKSFAWNGVWGAGLAVDAEANVVMTAGAGTNGITVKRLTPAGEDMALKYIDAAFYSHDVHVDNVGNIVLGGPCVGSIDLGTGDLPGGGQIDVCMAKLSPFGQTLWSKRFGDGDNQFIDAFTCDLNRNVVVAGTFNGTMDFGGGPMVALAGENAFVAKLDPEGGHLWSKVFTGSRQTSSFEVATDNAGNVIVANFIQGVADLTEDDGLFVIKLDTDGTVIWVKRFAGTGGQLVSGLSVDGLDNITMGGKFSGTLNFGGDDFTSQGSDLFAVQLDASGTHRWSKRFGNAYGGAPIRISIDSSNNILLAGTFYDEVGFGGDALEATGSKSNSFVAKLGPQGTHIWSKALPQSYVWDIAVDSNGNASVVGLSDAINVTRFIP